ncbi:MAG: hypothetical protein WC637_18320 [Victivallales bacterium]
MMKLNRLIWGFICGIGLTASAADSGSVWKEEAEKAVKPGALKNSCTVVDDPKAAGGKAVRIPYDKNAKDWSHFAIGAGPFKMQGETVLTLNLKGENLLDLSNGPKVFFYLHRKNPQQRLGDTTIIQGFRLVPDTYTPVKIVVDTGTIPTDMTAEIVFRWDNPPEKYDKPIAVLLDSIEIATTKSDAPTILSVEPAKPRFSTKDKAVASITIANPSAADATCDLTGTDCSGISDKNEVFKQQVNLKPGETKTVKAEWNHGKKLYGHEITVDLKRDGKTLDSGSGLFTVFDQPLWLSTANSYDNGKEVRDMHSIFYVVPATFQESKRTVDFWRRSSPGMEYQEFFSWSPGDISDLAPSEDPFPGGEGGPNVWYRSKALVQKQTEMLRDAGIWPISYVNGTCWADSGYKLFARHPEWFIYDSNGEVSHYEMDSRETYRHINDLSFDPKKYNMIFFQACLNHSLPKVQEYIASQYVKCAREMGFRGVRMDVRYLEVHPGERDFTGREIAPTNEEADRISAAAVKRIKELVHKEVPDFTFGYNYASPEEVRDMPLTMKERCAGAGWMLDEVVCGYQDPNSPYHKWDAFAKRMTSWGDHVKKLGGIYQPFDLRRNGGKFAVDRLYSSIFRLIGGGRPNGGWYLNSSLPFGDMGRLSTRYGELFYGLSREWVSEPGSLVDVKSSAPVMWKDMVFTNKTEKGKQLIVNLVNPPKTAIEENPNSEMPAPVPNINVTAGQLDGKSPAVAYLLYAEATARGQEAMLTLKPLELKKSGNVASVVVPELIAWKIVVFQY